MSIFKRLSVRFWLIAGLILFCLIGLGLTPAAQAEDPQPFGYEVRYDHHERHVIKVKFKEGYQIRLREGQPTALDGRGLSSAATQAVLNAVSEGEWTRGHPHTSEAQLETRFQQSKQRAAHNLSDPNLLFRLELPPHLEAKEAMALFENLPEVERASPVPKPVAPPLPPDYSTVNDDNFDVALNRNVYQRYLDSAPAGFDFRYAAEGFGGTGDGIKICDIEYWWNSGHADLPSVIVVTGPPDPTNPAIWWEHGTAVLGQLGGLDNGWGVTGMAPEATFYFAAADTLMGGYNVEAAISACMNNASMGAGDVILIEQQMNGPLGLAPSEWDEDVYNAIQLAVANGIVVVAAAGNGGNNLDDPAYSTGNGGHHPFLPENDSGAILVGAANSPYTASPRSRRSTSNYGSTIDLQGWGHDIVTTGYGTYYQAEGQDLWYRRTFGGTSGASPMVTAAVAVVQANYQLRDGNYASPATVKNLLRNTGTAQAGSDTIGPQPDLKAALEALWNITAPDPPVISPPSGLYQMPMQVSIDYAPGQSSSDTAIRYTLNGTEPTADSFIFEPDFDDSLYLVYGTPVRAKAFQFNASAGRSFESETTTVIYQSTTPKVETPTISPGAGTYNQPHQVTLSTTTPGATIRYRTDGRPPSFFYPGTLYSGPITLEPGSYEITARGYKDGYYKSDLAESGAIVVNALTLPAPTIYPAGGSYAGDVGVYLGTTILGADLHYTTDGSTPTTSSPIFSEQIIVTETSTVKAIVHLDGYNDSSVTEATYTILQDVSAPVFSPNGGTYNDSVLVSLSTATAGAEIRYTTNGADPTEYSTLYSGPFTLNVGEHTIRARAFLDGATPSPIVEAIFDVYDSTAATVADPVLNPFSTQQFVEPFSVTMRSDTAGANIYYTVGSGSLPADPTTGDTLYSGPVVFNTNGNYFIKARAFKSGSTPSNIIQSGQLSLDNPLGTSEIPSIYPNGGTFTNSIVITFSAGASEIIFYTKDGSEPDFRPPVSPPTQQYSQGTNGPSLFGNTTIRATAYRKFFANGGTSQAEFYFICATPTISPAGGTFTEQVTVTLDTATEGVTQMYYTTNGQDPLQTASITTTQYTGPFTLTVGSHPVKALCTRSNYFPSEIATTGLLVKPTPVTPSITTQPLSHTLTVGEAVTFTVAATGTPAPSYQWFKDGLMLAGQTEAELPIPAARLKDAGFYYAQAENERGLVTSTAALLSVEPLTTSLSAAKMTPTASVTAGQSLTYSLSVSNTGPMSATAQLMDYFAPPSAVLSATLGGGVCEQSGFETGVLTCTLPLLAPNQALTLSLSVQTSPAYSGPLTNTLSVTGTGNFVNLNPQNTAAPVVVQVLTTTPVITPGDPDDTTPPLLLERDPAPGENGVPLTRSLTLRFNEPMSRSTVQVGLTPTVSLTPSWSLSDTQLDLSHTGLMTATRYTVTLSSASDVSGNALAELPLSWVFSTTFGQDPITPTITPTMTSTHQLTLPVSGGLITPTEGITLNFPPDSFSDTVVISLTVLAEPSETFGTLGNLGYFYRLLFYYQTSGLPANLLPGQTYTLSARYDPNLLPAEISESDLALYYLAGDSWLREPSSAVELADNRITARTAQAGEWAILFNYPVINPPIESTIYLPLVLK